MLDRFQIGEIIYPILFGRKSKLSLNQVLMLARTEDTHTLILYSSSEEFLFNRLKNRGNDVDDIEYVFQANKLFKLVGEFFDILDIPVTLLDIAKDDLHGEVDKIIGNSSR